MTRFLEERMDAKDIKMGVAFGGITGNMCDLQDRGYVRKIVDTQDFDTKAIAHLHDCPDHTLDRVLTTPTPPPRVPMSTIWTT